jgi:hypothetical protein
MIDSNPMSLLMNNSNHQNHTPNNEKEQLNNIDSESRDFVTVGSNEDIFIPTLNNSTSPQQPFQVLSEEVGENIMH